MENKKIFIIGIIFFVFISLCFVSCKTNDEVSSFAEEKEILNDYIQNNNITVIPTLSGLYYIELIEGTGKLAESEDRVTVKYTGKLLNGTIFDSGTYTFVLGRGSVIRGWDEGIALMKKGGKAQLIIPSNLGYGSSGAGNDIPPYSTLLFSVELLDIQ